MAIISAVVRGVIAANSGMNLPTHRLVTAFIIEVTHHNQVAAPAARAQLARVPYQPNTWYKPAVPTLG